MIDLRSYSPDAHVNIVGHCFDYKSDAATLETAVLMLSTARAEAERLGNIVPGRTLEDLIENQIEHRLAEHRALLLAGIVAEAERALRSYPAEVVQAAADRFGL